MLSALFTKRQRSVPALLFSRLDAHVKSPHSQASRRPRDKVVERVKNIL